MADLAQDAATFIGNAIASSDPGDREEMARQLLTHAAAALVREVGHVAGCEGVYQLADTIAVTGEPLRWPWTRDAAQP